MKLTNVFKTCFFGSIAAMSMQGCGYSYVYTITFDTDGGSTIEPIKLRSTDVLNKPTDPTKPNSKLYRWCIDSEKTKEFDGFGKTVDKSFTLYAHYGIENGIKAGQVAKTFKVGESIKKSDISVLKTFTLGDPDVLKDDEWTCDDLKNGSYEFSYTDIFEGGVYKDGHKFKISYKNFNCDLIVLPFIADTKFDIQYVNLLIDDTNQHVVNYSGTATSFVSSSSEKLIIDSTSNVNGNKEIKYHLGTSEITKDDQLFIEAKDSNGAIIDYVMIQIFDNTEKSLEFVLNADNNSYGVCCALSKDKRKTWEANKGTLIIPTYYDNKPVTSIIKKPGTSGGLQGFYGCTSIVSIELPETLTDLCDYSFTECRKLEKVWLSSAMSSIGKNAFMNCENLVSTPFTQLNNLITIDDYAFCGCKSLTSIKFPNSLIKIGNNSFDNCVSLTKIIVSTDSNLTTIGQLAFQNVNSALINEEEKAKYLIAYDENDKANTHFCLTEVKSDPNITTYDVNEECYIVSPSTPTRNKYLETININKRVTAIGDYSFYEWPAIKNVNFAEGCELLGIGTRAFSSNNSSQCPKIAEITIPEKVVYLGSNLLDIFERNTKKVNFTKPEGWSTYDKDGKLVEFTKEDLSNPENAAKFLLSNSTNPWTRTDSLI